MLASRHRALPQKLLRWIDRTAGAINPLLTVVAIGLAMCDLLDAAQQFAEALPPMVQFAARGP